MKNTKQHKPKKPEIKNPMSKEKILEGIEESLRTALELEIDATITFDRRIYTKNKKYFLSTILKPMSQEAKEE